MAAEVAKLKQALLREVGVLSHNDGAAWKKPILDILSEFRHSGMRAVIFGGTLRSLLASRLFEGRRGRPRDVDLVVSGAPIAELEERFRQALERRTRFGGLQLKRGRWHFDVWPVGETWAFQRDQTPHAGFADLPSTTTFNLEAIAVEAWPTRGRSRALFSGDDQFFEGILSKTLELNREDSPFPELTVVRGLVIASELRFSIGPKFARYVRTFGQLLDEQRLDYVQRSHYGHTRLNNQTLMSVVSKVLMAPADGRTVSLPVVGQLHLWRPSDDAPPSVTVGFIGADR